MELCHAGFTLLVRTALHCDSKSLLYSSYVSILMYVRTYEFGYEKFHWKVENGIFFTIYIEILGRYVRVN